MTPDQVTKVLLASPVYQQMIVELVCMVAWSTFAVALMAWLTWDVVRLAVRALLFQRWMNSYVLWVGIDKAHKTFLALDTALDSASQREDVQYYGESGRALDRVEFLRSGEKVQDDQREEPQTRTGSSVPAR